jgi:hypothetical protein
MLRLPIYTFWEMAKNIDRIRAEEDKRFFLLIQNAFMGEPEKFFKQLDREQGAIYEVHEPDDNSYGFDRDGFNRMKALVDQRAKG